MADEVRAAGGADSRALAAEARGLAGRLELLAAAGLAAAGNAPSTAPVPPQTSSCAVGTDLAGGELAEWEANAALLPEEVAALDRARAEATAARRHRDEAAANAAELEEQAQAAMERAKAAASSSDPSGGVASDSNNMTANFALELAACEQGEAASRQRTNHEMELMAEWREQELRSDSTSEFGAIATLRRELGEFEERRQNAETQMGAIPRDANAAAQCTADQAAAAEAEERSEELEEEYARYQDELDSLRFQVKDTKRSQHRRAQELDTQVRRLEKHRGKLEAEYATRAKEMKLQRSQATEQSERAKDDAAVANQLTSLQDLNKKLTSQVQDAEQEHSAHEETSVELRAELSELDGECREAENDLREGQLRLADLEEAEAALRSSARHLQNRASIISSQVESLMNTAAWTGQQLEESEANYERAQEEETSAKRREEIVDWKLQVAKTHGLRGSSANNSVFGGSLDSSGSRHVRGSGDSESAGCGSDRG